jgi:hypothetical protein
MRQIRPESSHWKKTEGSKSGSRYFCQIIHQGWSLCSTSCVGNRKCFSLFSPPIPLLINFTVTFTKKNKKQKNPISVVLERQNLMQHGLKVAVNKHVSYFHSLFLFIYLFIHLFVCLLIFGSKFHDPLASISKCQGYRHVLPHSAYVSFLMDLFIT